MDCWMYQVVDDELQSKLFDSSSVPQGWFDSPGLAKEKAKPKKIDGRSKEGKKLKAKQNDDSTRTD